MSNYHPPAKWTVVDVAERFEEAVATVKRMPAVRVQGYFNSWPDIARTVWEKLRALESDKGRLPPPSPSAISRMEEAFNWIFLLEEEERKLVWLRAEGVYWKQICWRMGCSRATAWRNWSFALLKIATHLNATPPKRRKGGHYNV